MVGSDGADTLGRVDTEDKKNGPREYSTLGTRDEWKGMERVRKITVEIDEETPGKRKQLIRSSLVLLSAANQTVGQIFNTAGSTGLTSNIDQL